MKTQNYLMLAALSLLAAAACNKQPVEPETAPGTPMTLSATIGGPDTKLGFTDESNVLKGTWNANEKISVITLDASKNVKTIDTFTTGSESEGQKTASFTGTLSAGATSDIRVLYPALTETYEQSGRTYYGTPIPEGETQNAARLIQEIRIGSSNATFGHPANFTQPANGSTAHLGQVTIMDGTASVSGGALTVTLQPRTSVLRLDITFPASVVGKTFTKVHCGITNASDEAYYLGRQSGWYNYFSGAEPSNGYTVPAVTFGSWSGTALTPLTISTTNFTAYIPITTGKDVILGPSGGQKITISPQVGSSFSPKTITLSNNTPFEPGKMYRLTVDFTAP